MAGHAGDAVVQDAADDAGVVVDDLLQGVDAGVEEGGVAHAGHHGLVLATGEEGLGQAVGQGEGGAHADGHVLGVQGLAAAQGVAADVAHHDGVAALGALVEEASVGAAGAQGGRPVHDEVLVEGDLRHVLVQEGLADDVGVQLAHQGNFLLADAVNAGGFDLLLHEGV